MKQGFEKLASTVVLLREGTCGPESAHLTNRQCTLTVPLPGTRDEMTAKLAELDILPPPHSMALVQIVASRESHIDRPSPHSSTTEQDEKRYLHQSRSDRDRAADTPAKPFALSCHFAEPSLPGFTHQHRSDYAHGSRIPRGRKLWRTTNES
jgi:hypothetical protein